MIDCFIGYVGVRNCGGVYEESPSGQYINSLPGITLENIDKIADTEQVDYDGVWADVQKEAANRFRVDLIGEINECFAVSKDCDYDALICENQELLINAWKYLLGNQLMIERIYSPRLNRYTTVGIEDAKKLKDFYQLEYESYLKQAVTLMDLSSCELCCTGSPTTVTWLP